MTDLFEEELIVQDRHTQTIAGQTIVTWSDGAKIVANMQISNMLLALTANAQGVIPNGYLTADEIYWPLLTLNTFLKYPKRENFYVRITDVGFEEAGDRFYNERQFTIEKVQTLPR